jgi:hypothetical protein
VHFSHRSQREGKEDGDVVKENMQTDTISPSEIFNLREVAVDELEHARSNLAKAKDSLKVVEHSESGLFDKYAVRSGENTYEVVRMELFVRCTCKGFIHGHAVCKHIAATLPPLCRSCVKRDAPELGGLCDVCGPGKLLMPGVRFTCHKYYGKQAIFEVVAINGDEAICHNLTEPVSSRCPERTNINFSLYSLDLYRSEGSLKIVEEMGLGE